MNSIEKIPQLVEPLTDFISALSKGERKTFDNITRTANLSKSDFEKYCSWSKKCYTRNHIVKNEDFELILLCWEKGQITPIHDHGGEECWVKIIDGEFRENIYKVYEVIVCNGFFENFYSYLLLI